MKKLTLMKMVDMKWRIKKKNLLQKKWDSGFALNLDGTEIPRVETKLRFDP